MKNISIVMVLFLLFPAYSNGQDCSDALYRAQKLYESGKIQKSINRLRPCIDYQPNKDAFFESFKFLAQAYLSLNQFDSAKIFTDKLLRLRPGYLLFPNSDSRELTNLLNNYVVMPKIYIGLFVGVSNNTIHLLQSYSAYKVPQGYNQRLGFQYGVRLNIILTKGLTVSGSLAFEGTSIDQTMRNADYWQINFNEQLRASVGELYLGKSIALFNAIGLNGDIGVGLSSYYSARIIVENKNYFNHTTSLNTKDGLEELNRNNWFVAGKLSLTFKTVRGVLTTGIDYRNNMVETVNDSKRFSDPSFILNTGYVSDAFKMRLFTVNVGFNIPIKYTVKQK